MNILVILLLALLQPAPLLRLSVSTARSEFVRGDRFTVVAYLFNDGETPSNGALTITPPDGFELIGEKAGAGAIAPGRMIGAQWSYHIAESTPKGLARFVVRGGGLSQTITIRVGPIESPPPRPPPQRIRLPMMRA